MKQLFTLLIATILLSSFAYAAKEEKKPDTYFGVSISQDPVFGFYPLAYGGVEISKRLDFTFYGVAWTQDVLGGGGTPGDGTNLYTEFGVGINWYFFDKSLTISPAIGVLGGNYQSGGGRAVIGDAVVPSINIAYGISDFSTTGTFIYWKRLRKEGRKTHYIDMMEWIVKPTYTISRIVDVGLYIDHLLTATDRNLALDAAPGQDYPFTNTTYFWVGPSVNLKTFQGGSIWFSAGVDLKDYMNDMPTGQDEKIYDYYKLSLNFSL